MNSLIDEPNRGRNIRPSARKSIHYNRGKCVSEETMGKYGLKKRELNLPPQGDDVVDNVMSKMNSRSPIAIRQHNRLRRQSCDISDDYDDDDSDENILSKSSPPTFPSYSEPCVTASESTLEKSAHNQSTSSNHSSLSRSNNESLHSRQIQNTELESNNGCSNLIYICLCIILVGFAIFYNQLRKESQETDVYDKFSFFNDVKDIGEKYKVQDNSILKVKTGISTIFENKDTGSFIFTYDSGADNFNPLKLDQFVEDISAKSSKYLRNDTKKVHHVVVNPSNLVVHTEKEFMKQYQSEVDKWGVMLVKDVDNIPSHLAMAFHYYCDEFNPLVKKSAIFFTLNLANCSNGSNRKSTHEYVEKCLARKWNAVDQDKIGPLLTRVVNVVIDVTSIW